MTEQNDPSINLKMVINGGHFEQTICGRPNKDKAAAASSDNNNELKHGPVITVATPMDCSACLCSNKTLTLIKLRVLIEVINRATKTTC
jgi:hypothetical protein